MKKRIHNIITGSLEVSYVSEAYRKILLINLFGIIGTILSLLFAVDAFLRNEMLFSVFLSITGVISFGLVLLVRKVKNYNIGGYLLTILMFIANCYLLFFVAEEDSTAPLWHYMFPATALFVTNKKFALISITLLLLVTVIAFELIPENVVMYSTFFKTRFYATFVAVAALSYIFEFVRERTYLALEKSNKEKKYLLTKILGKKEEIERKTAELEKSNKVITDSINYAKNIQHAILPSQELIKEQFPESFTFFKPRDIVSGDFYWVEKQGDADYLAVADRTGHGVQGAFMSLIGYSLLNEMVAVLKKSDLISIINGLHKGIIDMLSEHGHEQSSIDDGMDISLLKLNNDKNTIELCCANSTAFICRDDRIEKLSGGICSVGDKRFNTNQLEILDMKIGSNDALYLLSDGYIDQFGGSENQKFMTARFESLINENKNVPLSKQETVFVKAFEDWKGDSKQIDDVLLIGIQFT